MKRTLVAVGAALMLTLPACAHGPYGHHGGPGGTGHRGCDCRFRPTPDSAQPCPDRPDCPKAQQAPAPCPNCPQHQQAPPQK